MNSRRRLVKSRLVGFFAPIFEHTLCNEGCDNVSGGDIQSLRNQADARATVDEHVTDRHCHKVGTMKLHQLCWDLEAVLQDFKPFSNLGNPR